MFGFISKKLKKNKIRKSVLTIMFNGRETEWTCTVEDGVDLREPWTIFIESFDSPTKTHAVVQNRFGTGTYAKYDKSLITSFTITESYTK